MNKVYIIGRITKDLSLKFYGEDKKTYIQFTLAVNNFNSSTKSETTNFINIVAFDRKAEIIQEFFNKGSQISVEGHLDSSGYINKDNIKTYHTNVILENFDFIDKKKNA